MFFFFPNGSSNPTVEIPPAHQQKPQSNRPLPPTTCRGIKSALRYTARHLALSPDLKQTIPDMHLMFNADAASGKRIYTLHKVKDGQVTKSAHPARFSPDDKW